MPFHPPFKQCFERGDLVYGLARQRSRYAFDYPQFRDAQDYVGETGEPNFSRIDQYAAIATERWEQQYFKKAVPPNQADFLASIERHPKYRKALSAKQATVQAVARKCKAGLAWAAESRISVHFVLDQLDMAQVVGKSHPRDKDAKSYTGCELRWVYRNRHNPAVQQAIQFWREGAPTLPPWVGDGARVWAAYHPAREYAGPPARFFPSLFACWFG
ncbi:hypothetical protein BOSP111201_13750 [Bordetella sputigena]|uniref:hypothetical protein n=1 Tax=Bordetella sputigena TaxID=1416810 RepID=UPI0039F0F04A